MATFRDNFSSFVKHSALVCQRYRKLLVETEVATHIGTLKWFSTSGYLPSNAVRDIVLVKVPDIFRELRSFCLLFLNCVNGRTMIIPSLFKGGLT